MPSVLVYQNAFATGRVGLAAAVAVVLTLLIFVVAFLITRPGRDGTRAFDRELSSRLLAGSRAAGVPIQPIHVADDVAVRAVTPDDLAA